MIASSPMRRQRIDLLVHDRVPPDIVRPSHVAILVAWVLLMAGLFAAIGISVWSRSEQLAPLAATAVSPSIPMDSSNQEVRATLDALSTRFDALAEQMEQMCRANVRVTVEQLPPAAPDSPNDFVTEHRDDVFRLIAEERDTQALLDNTRVFRSIIQYSAGYPSCRTTEDASVAVLLEAERRYQDIKTRLIPLDQDLYGNGPLPDGDPNRLLATQVRAEVSKLHEWRRDELVRIGGAAYADLVVERVAGTKEF
jgi:hypothetical protein